MYWKSRLTAFQDFHGRWTSHDKWLFRIWAGAKTVYTSKNASGWACYFVMWWQYELHAGTRLIPKWNSFLYQVNSPLTLSNPSARYIIENKNSLLKRQRWSLLLWHDVNLRIDIDQRVSLINCISVSLLNSDQVIVFSLTNSYRNVMWHLLVIWNRLFSTVAPLKNKKRICCHK